MLEERSMVSLRMPDLARADAYRIASFAHQTEVREIRLRQLPQATFAPPESFTRVTSAPALPTPRPVPRAHDQDGIEI